MNVGRGRAGCTSMTDSAKQTLVLEIRTEVAARLIDTVPVKNGRTWFTELVSETSIK